MKIKSLTNVISSGVTKINAVVTTAKNTIDENVEWYKSLPKDSYKCYDGVTRKVIFIDDAHQGTIISRVVGVRFAAAMRMLLSHTYVVASDDEFDDLDDDVKTFIIGHEIGHLLHGHIDTHTRKALWLKLRGINPAESLRRQRSIDEEFEADWIGATITNKEIALKALNVLKADVEECISNGEELEESDFVLTGYTKEQYLKINRSSLLEIKLRIQKIERDFTNEEVYNYVA